MTTSPRALRCRKHPGQHDGTACPERADTFAAWGILNVEGKLHRDMNAGACVYLSRSEAEEYCFEGEKVVRIKVVRA